MADQAAAGWYPDPNNRGQRRYWDGSKWTEHTDKPAEPTQQGQPAQATREPQAQQAQGPQAPQQADGPQARQQAHPPRSAPEAAPGQPGQVDPGQTPPGHVPPGGGQYPIAPPKPVWAGLPLARWGSRVGAQLLDGLVLLVLSVVLLAPGIVLLAVDATAAGVVLIILGGLGYVALYLFYAPYFMQRDGERNGQTLGKQWLGIRVVRDNGQPFDLGSGLLREFVVKQLLFAWVGGWFLGIPWLLDNLWPLWEDENRALHDMIVKTHVVRA